LDAHTVVFEEVDFMGKSRFWHTFEPFSANNELKKTKEHGNVQHDNDSYLQLLVCATATTYDHVFSFYVLAAAMWKEVKRKHGRMCDDCHYEQQRLKDHLPLPQIPAPSSSPLPSMFGRPSGCIDQLKLVHHFVTLVADDSTSSSLSIISIERAQDQLWSPSGAHLGTQYLWCNRCSTRPFPVKNRPKLHISICFARNCSRLDFYHPLYKYVGSYMHDDVVNWFHLAGLLLWESTILSHSSFSPIIFSFLHLLSNELADGAVAGYISHSLHTYNSIILRAFPLMIEMPMCGRMISSIAENHFFDSNSAANTIRELNSPLSYSLALHYLPLE
jgi:hypothetical protein